jgi:hypothetical protein
MPEVPATLVAPPLVPPPTARRTPAKVVVDLERPDPFRSLSPDIAKRASGH